MHPKPILLLIWLIRKLITTHTR